MWLAVMVVVMVVQGVTGITISREEEEQVVDVMGVSGRKCDLPCRLSPRTPGDAPKLILWYHQGQRAPVFSYDGRVPQVVEDIRVENGVLTVTQSGATLTLTRVTLQHAGLYECRVEFFKSPTNTRFVNLTIVEPPRSVELRDRQSGPPKDGMLGPYQEGVMVVFTCLARDGWPLPNVTWWRGGRVVDAGWEVSGPELVRNDLVVSRLERDWHNDTLTCTARNTLLLPPATVSATILMHLLPTTVVITGQTTARVGQRLRLRCTSRGSRPSALLTWQLEGSTVPAEKENTVYGRVTSSTLVVNVSKDHDGASVTCRAANPAAPGAPITNTTTLTVQYPPTVRASLGRSLKVDLLKEGDDVYFTCQVDANPQATSLKWYHEGEVQVQNVSGGIIISRDSLVVQRIHRQRAGRYWCRATNILATATSNVVTLRIRYRPECQTSPTTYFIYDKPINVTCTVTSHPAPSTILWQWNSSAEVLRTPPTTNSSPQKSPQEEQATSQLTVYPEAQQEDRALSCWAVNEMGRQNKPCGFSVKVAKMPMPLSSCRLANITASSLSLTCQRPDTPAAGTTTLYRAEVYFENRTLFANVTSLSPSFNVSRLDADTSYQIKVYVTHGPVTSQPVVVSAYTSRTSRKSKGQSRATRGSSVGGVVGGLLVTVAVVVLSVWARHYCRRRARRRAGQGAKVEARPPSDDSNPDVVPNIAEETYDLLSVSEDKAEEPLYMEQHQQSEVSPLHSAAPTQQPQQPQHQQQQQLRPQEPTPQLQPTQHLRPQDPTPQPQPTQQPSQSQLGLYSSQEVYQPLLGKATVTEVTDCSSGVRTYCPGSQLHDSEESMV